MGKDHKTVRNVAYTIGKILYKRSISYVQHGSSRKKLCRKMHFQPILYLNLLNNCPKASFSLHHGMLILLSQNAYSADINYWKKMDENH